MVRCEPNRRLLFLGTALLLCFAAIASLPILRGPALTRFLIYFLLAAAAYALAVAWLNRAPPSLRLVWTFAILFRLTLLFNSPPTLSDDVYRYIWDGRLANAGVNAYSHAVESPLLDPLDSPQRGLVNNAWMSSPYLPVAQAFFAVIYRLASVPLAAYLLLTTTIHPWYVITIIPLLAFLPPQTITTAGRLLWPWLFFSAAVALSYLTYLDPLDLREYDWSRCPSLPKNGHKHHRWCKSLSCP